MPAWRLDKTQKLVTKYDVGGKDCEPDLICHVVLCDVESPIDVSALNPRVPAVHMGPPLKESESRLDAVGTGELDAGSPEKGERRRIKTFVDDRFLERQAQKERLAMVGEELDPKSEYIIHPLAREPDGDFPLWRFSCTGFVLYAYAEAGIELIDRGSVPMVTLDFLKNAYPWQRRRLDDPDFREKMGIGTGDAWPVILGGYVIQSLNRTADEIRRSPYAPKAGDEFFPARPPLPVENANAEE